ncbi:MAG: aminotransferase class V-fold PLP-dependent enzyme [Planctomycetes bacterium]|nr:aminotransferase class V-fold PLP-dependent enzyme [Planctomycetota bacterium]
MNFPFDANAGVAARKEALDAFLEIERNAPGNPASLHRSGQRAQGALEKARALVAATLDCSPSAIYFTSGATEANNLAILGFARSFLRLEGRPPSFLSSLAEHPSCLGPLRFLQQEGCSLQLFDLDKHAKVLPESRLPAQDTFDFAATQWVNNETGVIQPIRQIKALLPDSSWFHVDAAQGVGKIQLVSTLQQSTSLVLSGHKFGAPKGVGVLRLQDHVLLDPIFAGGGHQEGIRPGTESPALAMAFAVALDLAVKEQSTIENHWHILTQLFISKLSESFRPFFNHAPAGEGVANTLNLTFKHVDGRMLLPACDAEGLELSMGSACRSGAPQPSPVLIAAGRTTDEAKASLRISFDWNTTTEQVIEGATRLNTVLGRLYNVAKG